MADKIRNGRQGNQRVQSYGKYEQRTVENHERTKQGETKTSRLLHYEGSDSPSEQQTPRRI